MPRKSQSFDLARNPLETFSSSSRDRSKKKKTKKTKKKQRRWGRRPLCFRFLLCLIEGDAGQREGVEHLWRCCCSCCCWRPSMLFFCFYASASCGIEFMCVC